MSPVHIEDLDMNDTCSCLNFELVANQFALDGESPQFGVGDFRVYRNPYFLQIISKIESITPPPPFFLYAIVSYLSNE